MPIPVLKIGVPAYNLKLSKKAECKKKSSKARLKSEYIFQGKINYINLIKSIIYTLQDRFIDLSKLFRISTSRFLGIKSFCYEIDLVIRNM